LRKLRDHGRMDKYRHDEVGTNARLDTLQAAVLSVKLRHLDAWNEARRRHAARYDDDFTSVRGVEPIRVVDDALPVYHQYVVRVADRDRARSALNEKGIAAAVHYPIPLHRQPALAESVAGVFTAADALADSVLSLPMFPELTDEQRGAVVSELSAFVEAAEAAPVAR
jgi:dTDP-4-amino-4,6-dideoxygalactose transaminase